MRASRLFILIVALVLGWSINAQQESGLEPESENPVEQQEEPESAPEENVEVAEPVSAGTPAGGFERFDPSEDISEDLSVPFPVDI
jgi:hypothetical protein